MKEETRTTLIILILSFMALAYIFIAEQCEHGSRVEERGYITNLINR